MLTRSRPGCQLQLCSRRPCTGRTQSKVPIPRPTHISLTQFRSWGRVLAAVGSIQNLSKPLEPSRVNVLFVPDDGSPPLPVLVGGEPENVDEVRAKEILSEGKFEIKIQLGIGEESAKYWTCDFSYVSLLTLFMRTFEIRDVTGPGCVISLPTVSHFRSPYIAFVPLGTEPFRVFVLSLLGIREDQRRLPHLKTNPPPFDPQQWLKDEE